MIELKNGELLSTDHVGKYHPSLLFANKNTHEVNEYVNNLNPLLSNLFKDRGEFEQMCESSGIKLGTWLSVLKQYFDEGMVIGFDVVTSDDIGRMHFKSEEE